MELYIYIYMDLSAYILIFVLICDIGKIELKKKKE